MKHQPIWWKESVIYQIYPRSFNDSNGDGIGDIPGIIEKLDYIKSLGIDVIWLCPVYQSPNDDNGYDISDYYGIMDEFGNMADFDQLLSGIHQRGMKLVMDLVVNHTSDEHSWFVASRSSRQHPKRDYYIWKEGVNGGPPNNWQSFFGGDAWEYDEKTDQYFLHLFTRKQPDLNWENDQVREEVYRMMKWWLAKGIDGFRMDVISLISKRGFEDTSHEEFTDTISQDYANGPRIHEFLQEMNQQVLSRYDILTVGEGPGITLEEGLKYVKEDRHELGMIFHFDHMFIDHGEGGKFDPKPYDFIEFKKIFKHWDQVMTEGGWSSIFLGNHDFPRIVSRFGNDGKYRDQSAKALALMLLTMRGTAYIYQGEEIGMTNVAFESIADYRDIETFNAHRIALESGRDLNDFMRAVHRQGRDNARTPVQWDSSEQAGFTTGVPWIKVNPNYPSINVASQENDPDSILNFYRQMVQTRKGHKTLVYGDFEVFDIEDQDLFVYRRENDDGQYLIMINFSDLDQIYTPDDSLNLSSAKAIIGNYDDFGEKIIQSKYTLRPWEAVLLKL
jgi:oligo-1,6-glucosidase